MHRAGGNNWFQIRLRYWKDLRFSVKERLGSKMQEAANMQTQVVTTVLAAVFKRNSN